MPRTLSGLFLVGALNRPRKRKGTNREIPGPSPSKSGKSRGKIGGKSHKGQRKRTKKEGQVQSKSGKSRKSIGKVPQRTTKKDKKRRKDKSRSGNPPPVETPPRLAALETMATLEHFQNRGVFGDANPKESFETIALTAVRVL